MIRLIASITCVLGFVVYAIVGTSGNVEEIKAKAPAEMLDRNWEVLRYEGFKYGSFSRHGGKVFYHVKDTGHSNTYYRVNVSMWNGELQYYYGKPETLSRFNIDAG